MFRVCFIKHQVTGDESTKSIQGENMSCFVVRFELEAVRWDYYQDICTAIYSFRKAIMVFAVEFYLDTSLKYVLLYCVVGGFRWRIADLL